LGPPSSVVLSVKVGNRSLSQNSDSDPKTPRMRTGQKLRNRALPLSFSSRKLRNNKRILTITSASLLISVNLQVRFHDRFHLISIQASSYTVGKFSIPPSCECLVVRVRVRCRTSSLRSETNLSSFCGFVFSKDSHNRKKVNHAS